MEIVGSIISNGMRYCKKNGVKRAFPFEGKVASESVAEQHSEPDEVTDESLFLTSSAASRRHL
ncbi:MAG: hypothetical protein IKH09_09565, partial [Clostridia bacterium]|nr:hypothetical protein [Clostridia bacterium]